jgi:5'-nucleotidase (lipoprotein e(P4) family)
MKYRLPLLLLICSCCTQKNTVVKSSSDSMIFPAKLYSAFYQQQAAEYKALCIQAYNLAHATLDNILIQQQESSPAIVTDIDETILDNSPYAVKRALQGEEYSLASWQEWTALAKADTLCGALSFLKYAKRRGVEIYYITNREEQEKEGTLKNLQKFGFPDADEMHVLLKKGTSGKEARRQSVAATHHILLYIGDNLADLSAMFDKKTVEERNSNVLHAAGQFGSSYILLPNPFYGDWESSAFKYNYSLTPMQKDSVIRKNIRTY